MTAWLGAFESPETLVSAIRSLRADGHHVEAYSPFPIDEIIEVMDYNTQSVAKAALIAAAFGSVLMLAALYYTGVVAYPLDVGARPIFSLAGAVCSTIIVTILWAALGALAAFLRGAHLPRLNHPVFEFEHFESLHDGTFFLEVHAGSGLTAGTLSKLGAVWVRALT